MAYKNKEKLCRKNLILDFPWLSVIACFLTPEFRFQFGYRLRPAYKCPTKKIFAAP